MGPTGDAVEPISGHWFLHSTSGAVIALCLSSVVFSLDVLSKPLHTSLNPVLLGMAMIVVLVFAIGIVRIKPIPERLFLFIVILDGILKGFLPASQEIVFRKKVSPVLWICAALIALIMLFRSLKSGTGRTRL